MARFPRLIIPGVAHHLTQRGNRRQNVFFSDSDKSLYLKLLADALDESSFRLLAYCLMSNHVHLVAVPEGKEAFSSALGELHRKYTTIINIRQRWRGHLWQGRFWSFPLDEVYLYRAVRYIERNPVRAGIVKRAGQYPWSSARGHLGEKDDPLLAKIQGPPIHDNWAAYLAEPEVEEFGELIHRNQRTGRPMGDDVFISRLEAATGLVLRKRRPGPAPGSKYLTIAEKRRDETSHEPPSSPSPGEREGESGGPQKPDDPSAKGQSGGEGSGTA